MVEISYQCVGVPGQHKMEVPAFSFDLKISVRCLQMSDISGFFPASFKSPGINVSE